MSNEFDDVLGLNLDVDPDKVEKDMEAPALLPAGWYAACLKSEVLISARDGGLDSNEMVYSIIHGEHSGRTIKDRLFIPSRDAVDDKSAKMNNRRLHFFHQLGVVKAIPDPSKKDGRRFVQALPSVRDAVGVAVLIQVQVKKMSEKKGNDWVDMLDPVTGKPVLTNQLGFAGILAIDDTRIAAAKLPKDQAATVEALVAAVRARGLATAPTPAKPQRPLAAAAKKTADDDIDM